MKFIETTIQGAFIIDPEELHDERGFFARTFCVHEFEKAGLFTQFPQCNISYNEKKATLRGMHYQVDPYGEIKIVRCTSGSVYDVIIDLRPESTTYKKWFGVELSASNRRAIYIPNGIAHGFITLVDGAELFYMMSALYKPDAARGVRFDDPEIGIIWPIQPLIISERDSNLKYCTHSSY